MSAWYSWPQDGDFFNGLNFKCNFKFSKVFVQKLVVLFFLLPDTLICFADLGGFVSGAVALTARL